MPYISFFLQNMSDLQNKIVRRNQYSPGHRLYPKQPISELELIKLYTYFMIVKKHYEDFFKDKHEELSKLAIEKNIDCWDFEYMSLVPLHVPYLSFKHDPVYQELDSKRKKIIEDMHKHVAIMTDLNKKGLASITIQREDGSELEVQAAESFTKIHLKASADIDVLFWKLRMFE